jgi:hypothetical protein
MTAERREHPAAVHVQVISVGDTDGCDVGSEFRIVSDHPPAVKLTCPTRWRYTAMKSRACQSARDSSGPGPTQRVHRGGPLVGLTACHSLVDVYGQQELPYWLTDCGGLPSRSW